ncbi:MAG: hypothetical protein IKH27_10920 [Oscillospiraceae bacterium]|nr:hypothetical protein [Oscillospiraceae bacterium]
MKSGRSALLLSVCLLTGCRVQPAPALPLPEPVLTVQSAAELTDAAADMLMRTETALTVSVPETLYGAAGDCVRAARTRSVLCGTMLETLGWQRSGRLLTVTAVYTEPPETVREKKRQVSLAAAEWAESVLRYPPAVRVLLAHERLCNVCAYSETAPDCGSAYGALCGAAARCSGYAEGFALLLEAAGVPVRTVTGTAYENGKPSAHAWNLVRPDGFWYHVDCTWDDTAEPGDTHAYFLCGDSLLRQTHDWDAAAYPAAEGGRLRYETVMQQMRDAVIPPSDDRTGRRAFASASR